MTDVTKEHRLYLESSRRLPGSPATADSGIVNGAAGPAGAEQSARARLQRRSRRKSRPSSAGFLGSSPCKRHRISILRLVRLPPSRPPTKSGARAGGRRLRDRRPHRYVPARANPQRLPTVLPTRRGLNRAHICVRNRFTYHPLGPKHIPIPRCRRGKDRLPIRDQRQSRQTCWKHSNCWA